MTDELPEVLKPTPFEKPITDSLVEEVFVHLNETHDFSLACKKVGISENSFLAIVFRDKEKYQKIFTMLNLMGATMIYKSAEIAMRVDEKADEVPKGAQVKFRMMMELAALLAPGHFSNLAKKQGQRKMLEAFQEAEGKKEEPVEVKFDADSDDIPEDIEATGHVKEEEK